MTKTKICEDCDKHKATINFTDTPYFSLTHGNLGSTDICLCCYLKRCEEALDTVKQNYLKYKVLFDTKGCE